MHMNIYRKEETGKHPSKKKRGDGETKPPLREARVSCRLSAPSDVGAAFSPLIPSQETPLEPLLISGAWLDFDFFPLQSGWQPTRGIVSLFFSKPWIHPSSEPLGCVYIASLLAHESLGILVNRFGLCDWLGDFRKIHQFGSWFGLWVHFACNLQVL